MAAKFREPETADEFLGLMETMSAAEIYEYYAQKPASENVQVALTELVDDDAIDKDRIGPIQLAMSADNFKEYMEDGIESMSPVLDPNWTKQWYDKSGSKSYTTNGKYYVILGIASCNKGDAKVYVKRKKLFGGWKTVTSITIDAGWLGFVWGDRLTKRTWKFGVSADSDDEWHAYFWNPNTERVDYESGDWPF
jgi:hypothetical protein